MRMPESSGALPSLSHAREVKIGELSQYFANDDLTLDELERRIERVYKAASVAELESITADLRSVATAPETTPDLSRSHRRRSVPARDLLDHARILALMSETRRTGRWTVPHRLDVVSIMSDTRLDLTQAVLPSGIVEMDLRVIWAACKLIVPPGVRVINEMHAIMGAVRTKADDPAGAIADPRMPTIRLSGIALMGEVKVVVRRREKTAYDYDDED
jgi:hypothetical protein